MASALPRPPVLLRATLTTSASVSWPVPLQPARSLGRALYETSALYRDNASTQGTNTSERRGLLERSTHSKRRFSERADASTAACGCSSDPAHSTVRVDLESSAL